MLVHRRVTPSIEFGGTHLHAWVEKTQTARSGVECTNREATAPPRNCRKQREKQPNQPGKAGSKSSHLTH